MAGLQEDRRVSCVLAIAGKEGEGQVDTSFPGSEFREWLLGKLTPNPEEPSCTPGYASFFPMPLNLPSLPPLLGQALAVDVGLGGLT